MPNMKIGLVCPYSVLKGGGVQAHVMAVQAELRHRGHDVYLITPRPVDHDEAPEDHVIFIGAATDFNSPMHTTVQVSASVGETVERMLAEERFDVLHFHEPWIPMLSMQILSRSQAANVATFHAKLPETMMSRTMAKVITPYTKPILKYIDAFTAVSNAAADYVCSLTDEPVTIIPNGIGTQFKPPRAFNDTRTHKTVLYIGRLEGRKGVKYLLRAFAAVQQRHPDVALIIAGDGPDREKLETMTAYLGLQNVTFKGYITDDEKLTLLHESDLFCAPAIYGESFGIVLLEAMATGLVTVAGDNPGYESVMQGLGAISLVNPRHPVEFSRRIELLLYEKELRTLWRQWATKELPQYSYTRIVDQYEDVYRQAVAEKQG